MSEIQGIKLKAALASQAQSGSKSGRGGSDKHPNLIENNCVRLQEMAHNQ